MGSGPQNKDHHVDVNITDFIINITPSTVRLISSIIECESFVAVSLNLCIYIFLLEIFGIAIFIIIIIIIITAYQFTEAGLMCVNAVTRSDSSLSSVNDVPSLPLSHSCTFSIMTSFVSPC